MPSTATIKNAIKNASPKLSHRRGKKDRRPPKATGDLAAAAPARVTASRSIRTGSVLSSSRTRTNAGVGSEGTTRALVLRNVGIEAIVPANSPVAHPPSPIESPSLLSPISENKNSPVFSSPKFFYGGGMLTPVRGTVVSRDLINELTDSTALDNTDGLAWNQISPPKAGKRLPPPSEKFCIVLGEFPTDCHGVNRELHNPDIGDEARGELGTGKIQVALDLRKNAHNGMTWLNFVADDGETKLQAQVPPFETSHKFLTSNCGDQPYMLADLYDQSKHITRSSKAVLMRYTLRFQNMDDLKAALHHMFLVNGTRMVSEWCNRECRFYRGPTTAPYKVNSHRAMDITHIEGREVKNAERPLTVEEEEDDFGEDGVQYDSQPLW